MSKSCLIIGGGVAGLTTALSLSRIGIACTIYELRATPATIGGAVNLAPNALRLLEDLEVDVVGCRVDAIELFSLHTGKKLGELAFQKYGPSLRVVREDLLQGLLRAVEKRGIDVVYDSKVVAVKDESGEEKATVVFVDGKEVGADFVLGCDGVHSALRKQYVEPTRASVYTGVSVAYSIVDAVGIDVHFKQTCLNSARFGPLLMSYVDPERTRMYLSAVMETAEEKDKQGWRVRGNDRQKTMEEIDRRYKNSALPCIDKFLERADDLVFYPVYGAGPGGIWSKGRVLLLGDAAHGMPPQGESTGLAIEDGVLLARIFSSHPEMAVSEVFRVYEKTRRPRIDAAYEHAASSWEGTKDKSWFLQKVVEWVTWMYLYFKGNAYDASVSYDVRTAEIVE